MNRYQSSTFRPAFGVVAAALSAVTLAVSVVLPMSFANACQNQSTFATMPAATEISIVPARIDAVATPVRTVTIEPIDIVASRTQAS